MNPSSSLICILLVTLQAVAQEPQSFDRLKFHQAPKPLPGPGQDQRLAPNARPHR